jgi:hypothetical protein
MKIRTALKRFIAWSRGRWHCRACGGTNMATFKDRYDFYYYCEDCGEREK